MHQIKMCTEQIEQLLESIKKQLMNEKTIRDTLSVTYKLPKIEEPKANICITDIAANKMEELTDQCDKEIAWHCTVEKLEKGKYLITDVFVFPQTVSGATVTSDETEYSMWLANLSDEIFNKLRMHGHSHVNMGVNPSGIDLKYQEDILNNLKDFYIFMIMNKKGNIWTAVYDVQDNVVYDNDNIVLDMPTNNVYSWAEQQIKEKVKTNYPYRRYQTTRSEDATPAQEESYTEGIVNKYYDKTGKKKNQEEVTRQMELEDYYYGSSWRY